MDKENIVALKSKVVTCPECKKLQQEDRVKAEANFKKMLANMAASPRKGPLRKPLERTVETPRLRFWSPAARRNPVRG
jgi:hypothetical protein